MATLATFGEADVAEHAFLRGGLRLLVAGEHREDDRLLGAQAAGMAGVERRAHRHHRLALRQRPLRIGGVRARPPQVSPQAERQPHLPLIGRIEALERVEALHRR